MEINTKKRFNEIMEEIHSDQVQELQDMISDLEFSINEQTASVGEEYTKFKDKKR